MKFHIGPIPPSRTLDAKAAGWTLLVSPSFEKAVLFAAAGMIPWILLAGQALRVAVDILPPWHLLALVASTVLLVPLHELVHALAYGQSLTSSLLWSGIWPQRGIWYVLFDAPLQRNRVVFMLVAPALCLSLVPLMALPFLSILSTGSRYGLLYLACIQAALCTGDLLSAGRILRQIPKDAMIHNSGWNTYWSAGV